ncbi:hypothetical protein [Halostella sp. PRR32]|nr:hypothetical protein [Halostella sp. PRR32]
MTSVRFSNWTGWLTTLSHAIPDDVGTDAATSSGGLRALLARLL